VWNSPCLLCKGVAGLICVFVVFAQQPSPKEDGSIPSFGTTVVASSGLRGDIYLLPAGTDALPRFTHRQPVGTLYTTNLNIPPRDFREGFPGITDRVEWFAIDYTGRFWIEHPGRYRFALYSDDGSKLYLDRRLILDNDGVHLPSGCSATVELTSGIHTIRVSYFQGPRYHVALILAVARPGESWRIFDTRNFLPPVDMEQEATHSKESAKKPVRRIEGGSCGSQ
jgi:hypothetical protein